MTPATRNTSIQAVDLKADLEFAKQVAQNEVSEGTRRQYLNAWRQWESYCTAAGADPDRPTTGILIAYLSSMARRGKAYSTIAIHKAGLAFYFDKLGFGDVVPSGEVKSALKGIRRTIGTMQSQKDALTVDELRQVAENIGTETLMDVRDRALILFGFVGAFRASEIARLPLKDVTFETRGARVLLRKSKGDQEGVGVIKGIPYGDTDLCPVKALRRWIDEARITSGPIFRGWEPQAMKTFDLQHLKPSPISTNSCRRIVKTRVQQIGLSVDNVSFHSLRISLVTAAKEAGFEDEKVMKRTNHKSRKMIDHYNQDTNAFDSVGAMGF